MSVIRPYFQPELDTARDLHLTRKEPRGEDLNGPAPHRAGSERRSRGSELVSLAANRPSPHCASSRSQKERRKVRPTESAQRLVGATALSALWLATTVTSRWENPEHPVLTGHALPETARAWAASAGVSLLTPRSPSARPGPAGGSDRPAPGPRQLLNILNIDTGQP